jgi:hypothetical protein
MMPLYDMMMNANNGDAMRAMAQQFGLSTSQVEQAMAALMPAFSTGLKRNASNPMDMSNFLSALAGGNHAQYFENMQSAFSPQAMQEGNGILGHLFGSKEVSRAVAAAGGSGDRDRPGDLQADAADPGHDHHGRAVQAGDRANPA